MISETVSHGVTEFGRKQYIFISIIIGTFCLMLRVPDFDFGSGRYLWGEDGLIFLSQAQNLGWASVLKPYAGYLHLYPRLITLLSMSFSLDLRPAILTGGWFASFFLMLVMIARFSRAHGFNVRHAGALTALICLQPEGSEVFFSITNAQWFLGTSLLFFVFGEALQRDIKFWEIPIWSIVFLTGPFAILVAGVMLLRMCVLREFTRNRLMLAVMVAAALAQLCIIFASNRLAGGASGSVSEWISAVLSMLAFGAKRPPFWVAAALFWGLVIYGAWSSATERLKLTIWILVAGFVFMLAGISAAAFDGVPSGLIAGGADRYKWIPYSMFFAFALLSTSHRIQKISLLCVAVILCVRWPIVIPRLDLQFMPFVRLAEVTDVVIPINPSVPAYPGWYVQAGSKPENSKDNAMVVSLAAENLTPGGVLLDSSTGKLVISATSSDPSVIFSAPVNCVEKRDIGVEIYMTRNVSGWLQLFWARASFDQVASYPAALK